MKKLIALAVVAVVAATLVGCGPTPTTAKPSGSTPTGTTPTK